ncbi:alpha/beta-hydrolase [Atractiella rhizophila]|nr:alpha/beta-hydrolase [Atractiella rhizophila]
MAGTLPLPPARAIPNTYSESFSHWFKAGDKDSQLSEERLLRRLSVFRSPNEEDSTMPRSANARISQIQLSHKDHKMNTLSIIPTTPSTSASPPPPIVIFHGYGAGLGFFLSNFESMAKFAAEKGVPVHFVDWLGMGRSSRPSFKIKAKKDDVDGRVKETEDWFLGPMEEWREKMGIEKMTLVGHSLGGYLSSVYALQNPSRVQRLVLLSPAGIPAKDDSLPPAEDIDPPPNSTNIPPSSSTTSLNSTSSKNAPSPSKNGPPAEKETWQRRLFTYAWDAGLSPFSVARSIGVIAPLWIGKYTQRRFPALDEDATKDLHAYLVNIVLLKGSGEHAFSHLLSVGAHARKPIEHRIHSLKVPVTFVYGEHDWMDPIGGLRCRERLEKVKGYNHEVSVEVVPKAGHHVYIDNPTAVNKLLWREGEKALREAREQR